MSKETSSREAMKCPWCGLVFAFPQFHIGHCTMRPAGAELPKRKQVDTTREAKR